MGNFGAAGTGIVSAISVIMMRSKAARKLENSVKSVRMFMSFFNFYHLKYATGHSVYYLYFI